VKTVLLVGREHGEIGAVAEQALSRVAVAISRGGVEKRYDYTDPNEDVALAAEGSRGILVAVADGHWGHRAAEVALVHLRDEHFEAWLDGSERSSENWYQDVLHALVAANEAILAAHTERENPRTTLALGASALSGAAGAKPLETTITITNSAFTAPAQVIAYEDTPGHTIFSTTCERKAMYSSSRPRCRASSKRLPPQ
jgi:hypothetical protein